MKLKENRMIKEIVMNRRSKTFGRHSCLYIGWAQADNSKSAIQERMHTFKKEIKQPHAFFKKKVEFTLKHYHDKGFTSGFFQQWDRDFSRSCSMMDYTPELFDEVLTLFKSWMSTSYNTKRITVSKRGKVIKEIFI